LQENSLLTGIISVWKRGALLPADFRIQCKEYQFSIEKANYGLVECF
jgi:hypothetical protein